MRTPVNYQAPYTSASLTDHMAQAAQTLCLCLKVTTADGASSFGLTTAARDLTLPGHVGVTFLANPGFDCSEMESSAGGVSILQLSLPFHPSSITKATWLARKWSHATLDLMIVNYETVNMGQLLFRFKIGRGAILGPKLQLEGRGLNACADANVCALTSAACRYDLGVNTGTSHCPVDMAGYTQSSKAVSHVTNRSTFRISTIATPSVRFEHGKVTFTSGANSGVTREIKSYDAATKEFVTKQAFPYDVAVADVATIKEGCDKTTADCAAFVVAGNSSGTAIEDFGGEPYTPLPEKANRVPAVVG
jgi:hypothetical protein